MERNKWETAIRCLEVALHPNTSDDEVIAGVNGYRRTAGGAPLAEVVDALAGREHAATLGREIHSLRSQVASHEAVEAETLRRLREAEQLIDELCAEIDAEKQNFAQFRAASAQVVDGLRDENFDLRGALETTRRSVAPARPVSPFQAMLSAVRQREGVPASNPAPVLYGIVRRHPWTA
jgi:ABC-type transporter Mla subunit MlaD